MFGFFVGRLKASKGKANPQQVNELLKSKLEGDENGARPKTWLYPLWGITFCGWCMFVVRGFIPDGLRSSPKT